MNAHHMELPATPENIALARRVEARLAADSRIVSAKAAFWRLIGVGGCLCLIGLGVAAAIYAYSRVTDVTTSADKIAAALALAFEKNTLKTEGTVVLDPKSQVSLADNRVVLDNGRVKLEPGATVAINDGGTVTLKPGGTVGVAGTVGVSGTVNNEGVAGIRRDIEQLQRDRGGPESEYGRNGAKVMSSITTFKEVQYGTGKVVTGWNWKTSNDTAPSQQYCYFDQNAQGASVRFDLARDGRELPVTRAPRGFQAQEAASNCIWFDGGRTQPVEAFR